MNEINELNQIHELIEDLKGVYALADGRAYTLAWNDWSKVTEGFIRDCKAHS